MSKGRGKKIVIKFDKAILGDVTGNEGAFAVTGMERNPLFYGEPVLRQYAVESVARPDVATLYKDDFSGQMDGVEVGGNGLIIERPEMQVFTESGNFAVPEGVTEVDVLVVAGGGGGGGNGPGGGGGGGGLIFKPGYDVTGKTSISVSVGAGGAGGTSNRGQNGQDSAFGQLVAIGGGGGGGFGSLPGQDGGSGGGGGGRNNEPGGTGTAGQGHDGGNARDGGSSSNNAAGGGGGYSQAGKKGRDDLIGGDGGRGFDASFLGIEGVVGLAGGGGGGGDHSTLHSVGFEGGGNGGTKTQDGQDAIANSGGGGGGGGNQKNGGNGGSGIVIVIWGDDAESGTYTTTIPADTLPTDPRLKWTEDLPTGTSITAEYATNLDALTPPAAWTAVSNAGLLTIPDPATGYFLWLKYTLATTDTAVTPTLLSVWLEEAEAPPDTIILTMAETGRFNNVEGDLTVAYDQALGNLAGDRLVESFEVSFTPTDLEPTPVHEHTITVKGEPVVHLLPYDAPPDPDYESGHSPDHAISATAGVISIDFIHIDDIVT